MASLKVLRIAAVVASSGGLLASTGIAAHASPWAWQHHQTPKTVVTSTQVTSTDNKTNVKVTNNNPQNAVSGDVVVASFPGHHGDEGSMGNSATANSGSATNTSGATFGLTVKNNGGSTTTGGSDMSGTSGNTTVTNKQITKTNNTTDLNVVNNNAQTAVTGNAVVLGNGGSATSGAATNNSTTTFTFEVDNSGATQ